MTDATVADIKNDIEELLNAHADNENIFSWYEAEGSIIVDLMDGTTLTISFRDYPEATK